MTITIDHMIKCAQRELEMRQKVYPKRVEFGKMSPHHAEWEIAVQTEIVETLQVLRTQKQPDFFIGKKRSLTPRTHLLGF